MKKINWLKSVGCLGVLLSQGYFCGASLQELDDVQDATAISIDGSVFYERATKCLEKRELYEAKAQEAAHKLESAQTPEGKECHALWLRLMQDHQRKYTALFEFYHAAPPLIESLLNLLSLEYRETGYSLFCLTCGAGEDLVSLREFEPLRQFDLTRLSQLLQGIRPEGTETTQPGQRWQEIAYDERTNTRVVKTPWLPHEINDRDLEGLAKNFSLTNLPRPRWRQALIKKCAEAKQVLQTWYERYAELRHKRSCLEASCSQLSNQFIAQTQHEKELPPYGEYGEWLARAFQRKQAVARELAFFEHIERALEELLIEIDFDVLHYDMREQDQEATQ